MDHFFGEKFKIYYNHFNFKNLAPNDKKRSSEKNKNYY